LDVTSATWGEMISVARRIHGGFASLHRASALTKLPRVTEKRQKPFVYDLLSPGKLGHEGRQEESERRSLGKGGS